MKNTREESDRQEDNDTAIVRRNNSSVVYLKYMTLELLAPPGDKQCTREPKVYIIIYIYSITSYLLISDIGFVILQI